MIWMWMTLAWADCPDPMVAMAKAEQEVVLFELDAAQVALDEVVAALACSGPASAELQRRYFLALGVMRAFDDRPGVDEALAASKQREAIWNETFGPAVEPEEGTDPTPYSRWLTATPSSESVELTLEPLGEGASVFADGLPIEAPYQLAKGLHLLQVADSEGPFFARSLDVVEATTIELPARGAPVPEEEPEPTPEPAPEPEPEPEPPPERPSPVAAPEPGLPTPSPAPTVLLTTAPAVAATDLSIKRKERHGSRGLLASGIVLGVLGGGGLGAAAWTKQIYEDQGRHDEGLVLLNKSSGFGGYGLIGLGTVLVGTSFVVNKW